MRVPGWVSSYIGLPFKDFGRDRAGLDCWGLVRLVLAEIFQAEVPSYVEGYGSALDRASVGQHIESTISDDLWLRIDPGQEKPGDVIVTRIHRLPAHVGIVVAPRTFLHVQPGSETVLEDYTRPHWRNLVVGFFRYQGIKVT